jgi:hypothetical protein
MPASPQVADGGNSLQIWRVAANILNNQLWTADKGWSSSMGVQLLAVKKAYCYEMFYRASDLVVK